MCLRSLFHRLRPERNMSEDGRYYPAMRGTMGSDGTIGIVELMPVVPASNYDALKAKHAEEELAWRANHDSLVARINELEREKEAARGLQQGTAEIAKTYKSRYRHLVEVLRRDGYGAALMTDTEIDAQVDEDMRK
jgi:hypothetical protein